MAYAGIQVRVNRLQKGTHIYPFNFRKIDKSFCKQHKNYEKD